MHTARLIITLVLVASPALAQQPAGLNLARQLEQVFVDVAATVTPSVVTIEVQGTDTHGSGPFPTASPLHGLGSGFIVDAQGTIFTNNHVVQNAERIEVTLADGRAFKADVVAGDEGSDVAVIRLVDPPRNLPVSKLGDSGKVRVGQYAIAIGAPFGYSSSFTVGHVSAMGRRDVGTIGGMTAPGFESLRYQDFLQVDTPINQGNSGGPLVDLDGRVIGINTAVAGPGGNGLGFSIPINMARKIAEQLVATGEVKRGWLGVGLKTIDPVEADTFGLEIRQGAMITRVLPDSPAARASLKEEDVVVTFHGRDIKSDRDLINAVADAPIGKRLDLELWRGNGTDALERLTLAITLSEPPDEAERAVIESSLRGKKSKRRRGGEYQLGLKLESSDSRSNAELGRARKAGGVVVREVLPGSRAADAGLEPGDVILKADHVDVQSPGGLLQAIADAERSFVPLVVERDGRETYLSIETVN